MPIDAVAPIDFPGEQLMENRYLTLSEIRNQLMQEGIEISERSLARYRDQFPHFQMWTRGTGKKKRVSKEAVQAFKLVYECYQNSMDRQEIEERLNSEFFIPTDDQTADNQHTEENGNDSDSSLSLTLAKIEPILQNQQRIIAELVASNQFLAQIIQKQDERLALLETLLMRLESSKETEAETESQTQDEPQKETAGQHRQPIWQKVKSWLGFRVASSQQSG